VLNAPYGAVISQDTPLSVDLGKRLSADLGEIGFHSFIDSFVWGHFETHDNYLKMYGDLRALPKGVYIIPCFRGVGVNREVIWVLELSIVVYS
jgi:hypothetical protein